MVLLVTAITTKFENGLTIRLLARDLRRILTSNDLDLKSHRE